METAIVCCSPGASSFAGSGEIQLLGVDEVGAAAAPVRAAFPPRHLIGRQMGVAEGICR